MPRHTASVRTRQHVKRGVFERVIASGFENKWKVEDHGLIIRYAVLRSYRSCTAIYVHSAVQLRYEHIQKNYAVTV